MKVNLDFKIIALRAAYVAAVWAVIICCTVSALNSGFSASTAINEQQYIACASSVSETADSITVPQLESNEDGASQCLSDAFTDSASISLPHAIGTVNNPSKSAQLLSVYVQELEDIKKAQNEKKKAENKDKKLITSKDGDSGELAGKVTQSGGLTVLSSDTIDLVYFCQVDEEYNNVPYGSNTLGGYGCGPTSMAMIVSTLTGKTVKPDELARYAVANGHYVRNVGTAHAFMGVVANKYGIPYTTVSKNNRTAINNALNDGKPVLVIMGSGHFTRGRHFMVLRGLTEDGKILVGDSGSRGRSIVEWDYNLVFTEISNSTVWIFG